MIQLPFEDRAEAGELLASELSRRGHTHNAVVFGLARGGVPVAFEVANRYNLPLDVIVARKLGVPWQPELAMGAIAGTARILNHRMIAELGLSEQQIGQVVAKEQAEMRRREELYRGDRPPVEPADLRYATAILVDDGLATGSTMIAAARYVRGLSPAKIVIAVPVGSAEAVNRLRGEADDAVCLATPRFFRAVGEWYLDFKQVSDEEVRKLLVSATKESSGIPGELGHLRGAGQSAR